SASKSRRTLVDDETAIDDRHEIEDLAMLRADQPVDSRGGERPPQRRRHGNGVHDVAQSAEAHDQETGHLAWSLVLGSWSLVRPWSSVRPWPLVRPWSSVRPWSLVRPWSSVRPWSRGGPWSSVRATRARISRVACVFSSPTIAVRPPYPATIARSGTDSTL